MEKKENNEENKKIRLKDIIVQEPIKIDLFPPLEVDLLANALESQPWLQRTETGWNITGLKLTDERIPELFVQILYRCDREFFSKIIYCCWEMGEEVLDQVKKRIIEQFKKAYDFYGPERLFRTNTCPLWVIGRLKITELKKELKQTFLSLDDEKVDQKFECGRAWVRVENNIHGEAFSSLKSLVENESYQKWHYTIPELELEIKYKAKTGSTSHHSRFEIVDRKKVFLSYTGGKKIKKWIEEEIGIDMINENIDVYYDPWDVDYSDRFTDFMNQIEEVDFTLMLFTPKYIEKLKSDSRGLSYERKIIESLIESGKEKKLILVIKDSKAKALIPQRYKSMKRCDLSTKTRYEKNITDLIDYIKKGGVRDKKPKPSKK
ncbi:MAG: TIR domain-containing protein [Candidatus Heimdallarchaeota archaeon]|nr:TIR domain-containing protein [Candidatus Heimdallarchaeota archaeon]